MKKSILVLTGLFVAMLFAVNSVQAQTQTFNLSATVEPYVEVNPSFEEVSITRDNLDPGEEGGTGLPWLGGVGYGAQYPQGFQRMNDAVYANCPFQVTYSPDEPILEREEVNGNGPDRLNTNIMMTTRINGTYANNQAGYQSKSSGFKYVHEGGGSSWYYGGQTLDFDTPHDGEVQVVIALDAAMPHEVPDFGNDNTWDQSPDAGTYTTELVATYSAL